MSKFKLTKAGRILIAVIVLAIIGGVGAFAFKSGLISLDKKPSSSKPSGSTAQTVTNTSSEDDTIHLSLDEWSGWLSIVTANNGLTTQPGLCV